MCSVEHSLKKKSLFDKKGATFFVPWMKMSPGHRKRLDEMKIFYFNVHSTNPKTTCKLRVVYESTAQSIDSPMKIIFLLLGKTQSYAMPPFEVTFCVFIKLDP